MHKSHGKTVSFMFGTPICMSAIVPQSLKINIRVHSHVLRPIKLLEVQDLSSIHCYSEEQCLFLSHVVLEFNGEVPSLFSCRSKSRDLDNQLFKCQGHWKSMSPVQDFLALITLRF